MSSTVNAKYLSLMFLLVVAAAAFGQPRLMPQRITLKSGKTITLDIADRFEMVPAIEGLKRVRFFAKAPDGRIFVTDMYNLTDNKRGTVYILEGWDERAGKFARAIPYMTGLRNPNSIQFYRDGAGQDWFYLAETDKLTRRKYTHGETKPTDTQPQTLATFPDYGLSYKYGGWHLTRTIAFAPNGKVYVSVGSSCNACVEKEKVRASIVEMNPDGTEQREYARGLRNAVGMRWIGNFLFVTSQGSDHLGLQRPDETFYAIRSGADYGWPYCHSSGGRIFADPGFKRSGQCTGVPAPYAHFPARSSALGFDYFDDAEAHETIKGAFLVALHGSTNKSIGHGYKVVIMRKDKPLEDFSTGFLQRGVVLGRPADVMKLDANSFLLSDDYSGIVYVVRRKGAVTPVGAAEPQSQQQPTSVPSAGVGAGSWTCLSLILPLIAMLKV